MSDRDYYEILGISKSASEDDIKKAFKKSAIKFHPDKFNNAGEKEKKEAEEKFKEINEAYSVLSDPSKRAQYDKMGHAAFKQGAGAGGYGSSGFGGGFEGFGGFEDLGDIFGSIFGDRGGFGGFGSRSGNYAQPGADLTYQLDITLEEAAFGAEKTIKYKRSAKCKTCNGTGGEPGSPLKECSKCKGTGKIKTVQRTILGNFEQVAECDVCHGKGKIPDKKCKTCGGTGITMENVELKRKIPAGISTGQKLRIEGMGEASENGGPNGDLYIIINVKKHKFFTRQGDDVYCQVPITFAIATLGGEIEVPTLEGHKNVKVPAGTQTGKKFKIRDAGIKSLRGSGTGSQIIEVIVEVPVDLNENQKKLLKEFDSSLKEKNYKKGGFFDKLKEKIFS